MYVQLYSSGVLTAEAVVSDLDSTRVRATVTQVHQTGIALQANRCGPLFAAGAGGRGAAGVR